MTKVLRIRSPAWKSKYKLVPSGIHGTERVVQGVLVTLVALADLLDDRWLLLAALTLASVQVVVLKYLGQALLAWGCEKYNSFLRVQLKLWRFTCTVLVASLWLTYVSAGVFGCFIADLVLVVVFGCVAETVFGVSPQTPLTQRLPHLIFLGGILGVGGWVAVLGWDDADLKFSWQSLQPWRWPLLRTPDSLSTGFRIVGLWLGA